jgi:hypothetical protein
VCYYTFIFLLIGDYGISRRMGETMTLGAGTGFEVKYYFFLLIYVYLFYIFAYFVIYNIINKNDELTNDRGYIAPELSQGKEHESVNFCFYFIFFNLV